MNVWKGERVIGSPPCAVFSVLMFDGSRCVSDLYYRHFRRICCRVSGAQESGGYDEQTEKRSCSRYRPEGVPSVSVYMRNMWSYLSPLKARPRDIFSELFGTTSVLTVM